MKKFLLAMILTIAGITAWAQTAPTSGRYYNIKASGTNLYATTNINTNGPSDESGPNCFSLSTSSEVFLVTGDNTSGWTIQRIANDGIKISWHKCTDSNGVLKSWLTVNGDFTWNITEVETDIYTIFRHDDSTIHNTKGLGWDDTAEGSRIFSDKNSSNTVEASKGYKWEFEEIDVPTYTFTYQLKWGDNIIMTQDKVCNFNDNAENYVPTAFLNDCTTLSNYNPEIITEGQKTVTVTATWNGPFEFSESFATAKWYTVGIHTHPPYYIANHIWKYDNNNLITETVARNAYESLTDAHFFCFTGNPYEGIKIYNKAAGETLCVNKTDDDNTQATFTTSGTLFVPTASKEDGRTVANGFSCFLIKSGNKYLNCNANKQYKIYGWNQNDHGSTCWFITPSEYPITYLNDVVFNPPYGSVGTKNLSKTEYNDLLTDLLTLKTDLADGNYYVENRDDVNAQLSELSSIPDVQLGEGYYRFISAYTGFATKPAMYYDSSAEEIKWATAALDDADYRVNSIFKVTNSTTNDRYYIYSPNSAKSVSGVESEYYQLGNTQSDIEFESFGIPQYGIKSAGKERMHADNHGYGTNTSGRIKALASDGLNSPSAWYIVPVNSIDINLNEVNDKYYATLCLPFEATLETGTSAYKLKLNNATKRLTLSDPITTILAGTPVLLIGESNTATASITNTTCVDAPLNSGEDNSLTGKFTDFTVNQYTDYFLGKYEGNVGFYKWVGTTLKANRAYMEASKLPSEDAGDGIRGFDINLDTAVGMDAIEGAETLFSDASIYNLAGQRISKLQRGLNIVNGKKVIIK